MRSILLQFTAVTLMNLKSVSQRIWLSLSTVVAVALVVGTAELASTLGIVPQVDMNAIGFAIVGLFVVTWAVALAVWRFARIEEKWAARVGRTG